MHSPTYQVRQILRGTGATLVLATLVAGAAATEPGSAVDSALGTRLPTCGDAAPDQGETCDDGNQVDGDGCSSSCAVEPGYDCTAAVAATPPINLVTDGDFNAYNIGDDWVIEHSLLGELICGSGSCGSSTTSWGSDDEGNFVGGGYLVFVGGSSVSPSTGSAEHTPVVIPPIATQLSFNWLLNTEQSGCPAPTDGIRLLIDGAQVWSSLESTGICERTYPWEVVTLDLAALGLNDAQAHTLRFEGEASVSPAQDILLYVLLDQVRIYVPAKDAQPAVPSECRAIVCGDGLLGSTEECDDGNLDDDDGCSVACQVEQPDFVCDLPRPPAATGDDLAGGGFEQGRGAVWSSSWSGFDPVCSQALCGANGAFNGAFYAWFGGSQTPHLQSISQETTISTTATSLEFALHVPRCESANDTLTVEIDGTLLYSRACDRTTNGYESVSVALGGFADGQAHTLTLIGNTLATNGGISDFFVDDLAIPDNVVDAGAPGACRPLRTACAPAEQFEAGISAAWTVLNLGAAPEDGWGLSDDGICGSANWSDASAQNNSTGGGGAAACADSDATGQINVDYGFSADEMDSYLCSGPHDLTQVWAPSLDFLVDYQAARNRLNDNGTPGDASDDFDDDFLRVLIGSTPPDGSSVAGYTLLHDVLDHLDTALELSPARSLSLDLTSYGGQEEAWLCFHYRGNYAWYAQVDNVAIRSDLCEAPPDTDNDGWHDGLDNCTLHSNALQIDTDGDGYGNACDADFNNDCVVASIDLGILRSLFFSQGTQADLNEDGMVNAADLGIFRTLFFSPPGPGPTDSCMP